MKDEVNLIHLIRLAAKFKWRLGIFSVLGLLMGVTHVVLAERIYRAEIVITSSDNESSMTLGGLQSALGSLSGLGAGLFNQDSSLNEAIALLQSRSIISDMVNENDLLPVLFADDWDEAAQEWTIDAEHQPTMADAIRYFDSEIRRVRRNRDLGLITLSIDWMDRAVAVKWASELVDRVNSRMRQRAVDESQRNLEYLQEELQQSKTLEGRQVVSGLIQAQINRAALASAKRDYAFRLIDAPIQPDIDEYVRPKKVLSIIGMTAFGFMIGVLVVFLTTALRESD